MALSDADKTWISNLVKGQVGSVVKLKPIDDPGRADEWGTTIGDSIARTAFRTGIILPLVQQLAAREGIDVDEAAIAAQVAASVAPILRAALVDAVTAGGSPEVIADAVVAKLGAALQG